MPSSAVRRFSDADDYAAAIRGGAVEMTVTERGSFSAKLTRIDLHRLWLQRFSENLPRVADVTRLVAGRAYFTFRTRSGPGLLESGREIVPSAILRHGQADQYYHRSCGVADFATMSLPLAAVAAVGETMAGADLTPPRDAISATPPPAAMARLQRLHAAAGRLADEAPEIIADPDAARGLEQALVGTLAECLAHGSRADDRAARGQHAVVMRRFRRVLEENPEQPLYIPEICKAIGVSERGLRVCSQEYFGMSPKRYLLLRRMHLARRALRAAAAGEANVTDVAMRYGFWQLGRFAVEYRVLFGETPSVTLQREPHRPSVRLPISHSAGR
jgi:AraC-like DNA-binding protein